MILSGAGIFVNEKTLANENCREPFRITAYSFRDVRFVSGEKKMEK